MPPVHGVITHDVEGISVHAPMSLKYELQNELHCVFAHSILCTAVAKILNVWKAAPPGKKARKYNFHLSKENQGTVSSLYQSVLQLIFHVWNNRFSGKKLLELYNHNLTIDDRFHAVVILNHILVNIRSELTIIGI
jgi:hypothetical protein